MNFSSSILVFYITNNFRSPHNTCTPPYAPSSNVRSDVLCRNRPRFGSHHTSAMRPLRILHIFQDLSYFHCYFFFFLFWKLVVRNFMNKSFYIINQIVMQNTRDAQVRFLKIFGLRNHQSRHNWSNK